MKFDYPISPEGNCYKFTTFSYETQGGHNYISECAYYNSCEKCAYCINRSEYKDIDGSYRYGPSDAEGICWNSGWISDDD